MKRLGLSVLTLSLVALSSPATGQGRAEIAALGGWQFGGSLNAIAGEFNIDDALAITGILDVNVRPGGQLELMYDWQSTQLNLRDITGNRKLFDMNVHYIQIGGLGYVDRGKLKPFGVATLGLAIFDPKDTSTSGTTRFSFTLGGGAKVFPTQRIGLRLEGRLLMTVVESALGLGCGGGGCSGSLWGWGVVQGVVSGGLIIAM
jgi:hypothetical protein